MLCFSTKKISPEEKAQFKKNQQIEKQLKEDKKNQKEKLLLLGTGDAGKSTFIKQMKVIHKDGFSNAEKEKFVEILRDNCLSGMIRVLFACNEWALEIPGPLKDQAKMVMNSTELTEEVAVAVQALWKTDAVKKVFERNSQILLPGGADTTYYISNSLRFAQRDFLPTQEDVIRAKLRTTGISEITFNVGSTEFTMVDVGGQRSERRKWLNCFSDISAVIFLAAMNEYDMVLEEDNKTNRMEESLKLFTKLTGAEWCENTSFILFLNKCDIFERKIVSKPLRDYFEDYDAFAADYSHLSEYEKSCEYIKAQYIEAFNGIRMYPFITCAIETENCKLVFSAVRDTIISNTLVSAGL